MLRINYAKRFKKDYKRIKRDNKLTAALWNLVELLQSEAPLPLSCRDHALTGNWKGYRECHIKPDLLLIYKKEDLKLHLIRLGSHSKFF